MLVVRPGVGGQVILVEAVPVAGRGVRARVPPRLWGVQPVQLGFQNALLEDSLQAQPERHCALSLHRHCPAAWARK